MRTRFTLLAIFFFLVHLAGNTLNSQAQTAKRTLGKIERFDSQLDNLLGSEAQLEILADGFTWTEGPVWMGDATNGAFAFFPTSLAIPRLSGLPKMGFSCS